MQISSLLLFVKRYKEEVLGVGEVALPGEGAALSEAAAQRHLKDSPDHASAPSTGGSTNGTHQSTKTEYVSPPGFAGSYLRPKPDLAFLSLRSAVAVARASFPRRVRLFMLSAPVTTAPCGTPAASYAQCVVRAWWTWFTSGPTRSCFVGATTARASGLDAAAVTR